DILDKNGEVLTKSVSTPSVILIPQQIKNKQDTANYLADILGLTEKEAYNYVTKKASNVRIHLKGRKISASQEEKLAALNLDGDRKSTRLNSSHVSISYAVFCLKKKKKKNKQ